MGLGWICIFEICTINHSFWQQIRGILNKLTPEKFEKLVTDILNVGLDSTTILKGVILLVSYIQATFSYKNGVANTLHMSFNQSVTSKWFHSIFRYLKKLSMNLNTRLCMHSCANGWMKRHQILIQLRRRTLSEDFCSISAEMNSKIGKCMKLRIIFRRDIWQT